MSEHAPIPGKDDQPSAYEPPLAEDIDTATSTAVTAAGALVTIVQPK